MPDSGSHDELRVSTPLSRSQPSVTHGVAGYTGMKALVVSDVHLNNHPYEREGELENPRRRNFREFLTQTNQLLNDKEKVVLVLNGDIIDITGSWFDEVVPWDPDTSRVNDLLKQLVLDIMENNLSTCQELRRFIQHPLSEIVYVFGNHDGLLESFPESQEVIREFLSPHPTEQARIHFAPYYESRELDLYIEHGHRLDPFNHSQHPAKTKEPPIGDVINVLIVNRFVELTLERMRAQGYSESLINSLHARLHDIEYLRPLSLLPVWIQNVAHEYEKHPENVGKPQRVDTILIEVVSEILQDPNMIAFMTQRLQWPRPILPMLIKITLRIPWVLPVISFITSKLMRRTHNNKYQYRAAQRIRQEKGYRLIAFGHTHIPGVLPLSDNAYYFNTGSWKPVINLFKHTKDPVELEYLNPEVQFNKVERCGILTLEKSDLSGKTPAEFSLQTIQSGMG